MEFLSIVSYASQVAIAVIILYYVVELLPMPDHIKKVVQALILLVAIIAVISSVMESRTVRDSVTPPRPNSPSNPSIIK